MASTQGQNCQRGIVFLCFIIILFFLIIVIIKMVKKLIDTQSDEDASGKYKEGEGGEAKKEKKGEDSTMNFD